MLDYRIFILTKDTCLIMCLFKHASRQTHKQTDTHEANSPPERFTVATDAVMKQLHHGQAPTSKWARARVWFLSHLDELLVYSYTVHAQHTSYWHGNPLLCIFLSSRKGLRPIMRKSIKFLFCWVVLQCVCVCACVCTSCRTSLYGCRIHKTSPSAPWLATRFTPWSIASWKDTHVETIVNAFAHADRELPPSAAPLRLSQCAH